MDTRVGQWAAGEQLNDARGGNNALIGNPDKLSLIACPGGEWVGSVEFTRFGDLCSGESLNGGLVDESVPTNLEQVLVTCRGQALERLKAVRVIKACFVDLQNDVSNLNAGFGSR